MNELTYTVIIMALVLVNALIYLNNKRNQLLSEQRLLISIELYVFCIKNILNQAVKEEDYSTAAECQKLLQEIEKELQSIKAKKSVGE